jgi:hypothetical protein
VLTRVTVYADPFGAEKALETDVTDWQSFVADLEAAAAPRRLSWRQTGDGAVGVWPHPEDPVLAVAIGASVVSLGFALYSYFTAPEALSPAEVDEASPNNSFGSRSNRPRLLARVPEIFGSLTTVPDLVSVPYRTYEDHRAVETALLCVGRGRYVVGDILEGETSVTELPGYGARVYAPGTWPGNGSPQLSVGTPPTDPPLLVYQVTVSESELPPPNAGVLDGDVRFKYPNRVSRVSSDHDMEVLFPVGSSVLLKAHQGLDTGIAPIFFLSPHVYVVAAATPSYVEFSSPASVDSDWNRLAEFVGGESGTREARLERQADSDNWVEFPFVPQLCDRVVASFVAPDGVFEQADDGQRRGFNVSVRLRASACDADGDLTGPEYEDSAQVLGSSGQAGPRYVTVVLTVPLGYYRVAARRASSRFYDKPVTDAVYMAETYVAESVDEFAGDITLLHSRAKGYLGRENPQLKLSVEVTRALPAWDASEGTHEVLLFATRSAASAAAALCLDPRVGGLTEDDADFASLYAAENQVSARLGAQASFDYTFDSEDASFEDLLLTALRAGFLTVHRDGPRLRFRADVPSLPTLLLNSRCVVPGSATSTFRLGLPDGEHDGVELRYFDPESGEPTELVAPPLEDSLRPRKLETAGVRDHRLARLHAWREWNLLRHSTETVAVTVTAEGQLAEVGDVVLLVDQLRPGTRAGELAAVDGAVAVLDRDHSAAGLPAELSVQLADGSVDSVAVTGYDGAAVSLARSLSGPATVDPEAYARAAYALVPGGEPARVRAYEVTERQPRGRGTWGLALVEYSFMRFSYDALKLWMPLHEAVDWGPDALAVSDSAAFSHDADRGHAVRVSGGTAPSISGLDLDYAAGFTASCWVNDEFAGMLFFTFDVLFHVGFTDPVVLDLDEQGAVSRLEPLPLGWTHVAATVGGGAAALYVGGELVGEVAASVAGSGTPTLLATSDGLASDFRLWRSVLSASDVRALAAATAASALE